MTRRQPHLRQFADIPRANDNPAGVRIVAKGVNNFVDLVYRAVVGWPSPPLAAIDWSHVAVSSAHSSQMETPADCK